MDKNSTNPNPSPFTNVYSQSANYYDRNIQVYIENNRTPSDFIDEFIALLRHGGKKEQAQKEKILDLGCGPGVNAGYMHSKNFHVIGIDLSKNMIEHARKTHPHVEFLVGDMQSLSRFPPDHFEGIFASYSLIHLPKEVIPSVLTKLYKILKPSGIIYISVQSGKSSQGFFSHPLTPGEQVFLNIFSKKEISNLLSQCGFKIISQREKPPHGRVFSFTKLFILAKKPPEK